MALHKWIGQRSRPIHWCRRSTTMGHDVYCCVRTWGIPQAKSWSTSGFRIPDFWTKPYVSYVSSCYDRQPLATNYQLPIYRWFIVGSWYGRSPTFQVSFGFSQPLALHILRKTPRAFLAQAHFETHHIPVPCWSCYKRKPLIHKMMGKLPEVKPPKIPSSGFGKWCFHHVHEWCSQWEFQDPKMDVLYHRRPYSVGIFPDIGLI